MDSIKYTRRQTTTFGKGNTYALGTEAACPDWERLEATETDRDRETEKLH